MVSTAVCDNQLKWIKIRPLSFVIVACLHMYTLVGTQKKKYRSILVAKCQLSVLFNPLKTSSLFGVNIYFGEWYYVYCTLVRDTYLLLYFKMG